MSSNGGTLSASTFGKDLKDGTLDLPDDEPLPNGEHLGPVPFVFVGLFNFHLSHARRIVENAFGIMAAQFSVYYRVMELSPCNSEKIVKATTILHNFMRWGHHAFPATTACGGPSGALNASEQIGNNTASREALAVREK